MPTQSPFAPFIRISIALLCLTLSPAPATELPEPDSVILLAGQSNMVGFGFYRELTPEQKTFPENIQFLNFIQGEPRELGRFGPELGLAHALGEAFPEETFRLIKDGTGGTSLYAWSPDYDAESAAKTKNEKVGPLYEKFQKVIEAHRPAHTPVRALLWMQGERDARFDFSSDAYADNLRTLIAAFRRDLDTPDLPILIGQIRSEHPKLTHAETVRAAQTEVAAEDPLVFLIPTDDISLRPDKLHFDTAGQLKLGRRYAKTLIPILQATEVTAP